MDQIKCGLLIRKLRQERGMTQAALAERLSVSDKAVSKWERGMGCPDVSLLNSLSSVFGVNIECLLNGSIEPNRADGGNMKRTSIYVCPYCGGVLAATCAAEISCCSRKLEPLKAVRADEAHSPKVEISDDEYYITVPHEMTKTHFLRFAAYSTYDRALIVRMYPEQEAAFRMPIMRGGKLYICCSEHGLMEVKL